MKLISLLFTTMTLAFFTTVETMKVDIDKSTVEWKATKVTGKHNGTINLSDGELTFENEQLSGGSFTIDMSTIKVTDIQGQGAGKLEGHLKSADFFGVEAHPKATFNITKVAPRGMDGEYRVTGDITIKGMTKEVKFNTTAKDGVANATITLDRTDFDVRYGSGSFFSNLGDKTIDDEFTLEVSLSYSK